MLSNFLFQTSALVGVHSGNNDAKTFTAIELIAAVADNNDKSESAAAAVEMMLKWPEKKAVHLKHFAKR